ncbi:MAG: site-specific integrase, partial [Prevotella sp.]|nr:site-specific integrase [Prevotella sp.]
MAETRGKNKNLVEAGNPRLLKKEVKGGTEYSLYLEYQLGYNRENGASIRKKETLSLYLKANPRTPVERQQNKET